MGLMNPNGAVWRIAPDCPVTRRKWYHKAITEDGTDGVSDRRFSFVLQAVLERDPAKIILELPDGRELSIERMPPARKEPD